MNKPNFSKIAKDFESFLVKRSPEILTGIGIAGMLTTTVMAVRATPKALDLLAEVKEMHTEDTDRKEIGKDIVTKVAPVYIPAIITGTMSTVCLIGACSVNSRRTAALATAYALSESTLKEYQAKVIETIGEKKEQSVRDSIAKDRVEQNPVRNTEVYITKKGETLCLDMLSMRYFKSDIDTIRRVENELNKRLLSEMYISLNEFYYEIGLSCTKQGNDLGWNIGDGLIEFHFSPQLSEDNTPCVVVDYGVAPRYDFRNLM